MINRGPHFRPGWNLILDSRLLHWSLQALLLITMVCVFVPFLPAMPRAGPDASWIFGINQAVAQGMVFGRDIVFTYGPYASIYTKAYHPATDQLMLIGSLYLGLLYVVALLLVAKDSKWYMLVIFWLILPGLMYSRSAVFSSYPLLVGVFCFTLISSQQNFRLDERKGAILTLVLFSPFGLLPLIKGSFSIFCGAVAVLAFFFFLLSRRWMCALAVVMSIPASLVLFWIVSGQSIVDLPAYFISMVPIISGYTEAMSKDGSGREIACYIVVSFFLLGAVLLENSYSIVQRLFVCAVFFVFLFLAFKGGFVRHDWHSASAATSLLIAALLFAIVFHTHRSLVILFLSISVWVYIDSHARNTSVKGVVLGIQSAYSSAWHGLGKRSEGNAWLENRFNKTLQQLNERAKFPVFEGTTDIYSYNQSYLIASENRWNPRPVFQSYAAYGPALGEINNDKLLGENAPDNIIFKVEPIDRRIPSIEDGPSWLSILTRYQPSALENGFLYLHKKDGLSGQPQPDMLIGQASYAFGDKVPIPENHPLVFAEISMSKNILGKVSGFLFRPEELRITLTLESGASRTYRIIPKMAEAGFLVSPLIENTVQFGRLFGDVNGLSDKKVRSFSIAPVGDGKQWQDSFEVVFKKATPPPPIDISKLYKFDTILGGQNDSQISLAKKCYGSIDSVNGSSPAPKRFSATNVLNIEGWLATSVSQGLLPDAVLVVLRDENGVNTFIETRKTTHAWAGRHFKKAQLASSGYTSIADVSGISGNYSLGLAFVEGDHIKICPQFDIPATLEGIPF